MANSIERLGEINEYAYGGSFLSNASDARPIVSKRAIYIEWFASSHINYERECDIYVNNSLFSKTLLFLIFLKIRVSSQYRQLPVSRLLIATAVEMFDRLLHRVN